MIEDTNVWFTRMSQVVFQITGESLSRNEFASFVGREPWDVVTNLLDDTTRANENEDVSAKQIASLTAKNQELTDKLAAQSVVYTPSIPQDTLNQITDTNKKVTSLYDYFAGQFKTFIKYIKK